MRIALIDGSFLHYTGQLANGLAQAGHEVLFIAKSSGVGFMADDLVEARRQFAEIVGEGVCLEWVDIPLDNRLASLPANLRSIARMVRLIREHRPEVLHLQETVDYRIWAAVALSQHKYPLVLTVHNAELHPGKRRDRTEFLRPWLRRRAQGIVVHGEDVKRRLLAVSDVREELISKLPIGAYAYYRRWLSDAAEDGKTVLFFGSVFLYKGIEYLIRAVPQVSRLVPDAHFVIAGSGPDWPRCRDLITEHARFTLMERRVTDREVTQLFENAAVVVLPYLEASQSAVLLVAIALGKPVVITNVGCMPDMVEDGETGFIVPPRDENALADAIVRLLQDRGLRERMGAKALEKSTSGSLSWNIIAESTVAVYESAIATRREKRVCNRGG